MIKLNNEKILKKFSNFKSYYNYSFFSINRKKFANRFTNEDIDKIFVSEDQIKMEDERKMMRDCKEKY